MNILKTFLSILFMSHGFAHAQPTSTLVELTTRLSPWERMASFEVLPLHPVSHRYSNTYAAGAFLANTAVPHFPYSEYGKKPITSFSPILINKGLLETDAGQVCNYFVRTIFDLGSGFVEKTLPVLYVHSTPITTTIKNNFFTFELLDNKGRSFRFRISIAEQRHTSGQLSIAGFSLSLRGYNVDKINTSIFNNPTYSVPNYKMPFEVFKSIQLLKGCQ